MWEIERGRDREVGEMTDREVERGQVRGREIGGEVYGDRRTIERWTDRKMESARPRRWLPTPQGRPDARARAAARGRTASAGLVTIVVWGPNLNPNPYPNSNTNPNSNPSPNPITLTLSPIPNPNPNPRTLIRRARGQGRWGCSQLAGRRRGCPGDRGRAYNRHGAGRVRCGG